MLAALIIAAGSPRAEQAFTQIGSLPDLYYGHTLEASNGHLYLLGGTKVSDVQMGATLDMVGDKVYYAQLTSPGNPGPWTLGEPLPTPSLYGHTSGTWNGTLYVMGGVYAKLEDPWFFISNAVYYSRLQADGRPGPWVRGPDLPKALFWHGTAIWNGMLYITGGWGYVGLNSEVYGAEIQADGSIGPWNLLTAPPTAIYAHTMAQDGALYVLGGAVDNGTRIHNEIYFARIMPDKTLDTWQRTTPLPFPLVNHTAEVIRGRVWVSGGWDEATPIVAAVNSAPIQADKSLGAWEPGPSLPTAVYLHASAVLDDALYVGGGIDTSNNAHDELWGLLPPPVETFTALSSVFINGQPAVQLFSSVSGIAINAVSATEANPAAASALSAAAAQGLVLASGLYDVVSPVSPLPGGGTILFRYDPAGTESYLQSQLRIYHYDAAGNTWTMVADTPPDLTANTLVGPVTTLSMFALFLPDRVPPATSLAFGGGRRFESPAGALFVSSDTRFVLTAIDDRSQAGDAAGVGVATTSWAVDDQGFTTYTGPVSAPGEGSHWFRFYSIDRAGNIEPAHAEPFALDATRPLSSISIGRPSALLESGEVIISSSTLLSASAEDPPTAGVASGVAELKVGVDGATPAPVTAFFMLPAVDGAHTIQSQAVDHVGNVEAMRSLTVLLDQTPPISTLTPSAAPYSGPGGLILNASAALTFGAADPLAGGVAAGVHHTEVALDGAAPVTVTETLVPAEGSHVIRFWSVDHVGNVETWKEARYAVDATVPATTLSVGSPMMRVDGRDVVTSATPLSLAAQDPTVAGVTSGVSKRVYRIDGGAEQAYSAPFTLTPGDHAVRYRSIDNAGNAEAEREVNFSVAAMDSLPPRTSHAIIGATLGTEPVFVAESALFALSALDDRSAIGDQAGVGVASTSWAFDAQPFALYSGSIAAPAEGNHWFRYFSADRAGNAETANVLAVAVDATPPVSSVAIGSPRALLGSGETVISSYTVVSVAAQDPAVAGVASGVKELLAGVDAAAPAPYAGSFALGGPDGPRTVRTQAVDHVGHLEAVRVQVLLVDQTPPVTALTPTLAPLIDSGGPILGAAAELVFSVEDPPVNGTASGSSRTEYAVDAGPVAEATATLVLAEGGHTVRFRSIDNVSNREAWREAAYRVDATPPLTTLTVGSPVMRVSGIDVVTQETPLVLSAEDPSSAGVASGLRATTYRINDGSEQAYAGPFRLAAGSHTVSFRSTDNAGNAEAERAVAFAVQTMDALPPRTTHSIVGATFGADPVFLAASAGLFLAAVDDGQALGDASGVGSAETFWAYDTHEFAVYAGSIAPPAEGSHWLRYFSVDLAGNAETAKAAPVAVDATPPASELAVGSPQVVLTDGTVVVSTRTLLSASAQDPLSAGVASGVSAVLVGIDEQPEAAHDGFFSLPPADGAHTVRLHAVDNVGNMEPPRTLAIHVDRTPPATTLSAAPAAFETPDGPILGAEAHVSFSATDPVVNGTAAGLNHIEHAIDGAAAMQVTETLVLAEGGHSIRYRAVDNVANEEAWRTANYRVDATAPQTTLSIGYPVMSVSGRDVVTPQTPVSLEAVDPVSAGVASGVNATLYRVDQGAEQAYAAPLHLPVGPHTVRYRSVDNAGNAESERSVELSVEALDVLPPRTAHSPVGQTHGADPLFMAASGSIALAAVDDRQTLGDAAGVGVESTTWAFDAGAFAAYAGPVPTASEGSHWLRFYSVDRAGNAEEAQALLVAVDASAPVTSMAVGSPQATLASGLLVIASHTLLSASAADPILGGVASGLAYIRLGIDGAEPSPREGPFLLPATDGSHTILYQAIDNVGNTESMRALSILVDKTAPVTSLSVSPPPQAGTDGATYLAATSSLTLTADDPTINGAASGILRTELGLDGATAIPVSAAPALEEGAHTLRVRSIDNVGNAEAWHEAAYRIDATAPRTTLEVGYPVMRVSGGDVVTPETPLSLVAQDPVASGVASGVGRTAYRIDGGPEQSYAGPFHLAIGEHAVRYRSIDHAGNVEPERSVSFTVELMDVLPPRTAHSIAGRTHGADPVFMAASARITLAASDDRQITGDGAGVGVESSHWAYDDQAFTAYAAPAEAATEGSHWLRFYSVDKAGNAETARAVRVAVDATPPLSSIEIGSPQATLATGALVVASHTLLALSADDPSAAGVASGLFEIRLGIDDDALSPRQGLFGLPPDDGPHAVRYQAVDNVGNVEPVRSITILVDRSAPVTSLSASPAPHAGEDGAAYLSAASELAFDADDPVVNGVAAGVLRSEAAVDGAAPTDAGALSLAEGEHSIRYRSLDNVGNAEAWREARYRVDATAPRTTLEAGFPVMRLPGEELLTPETPIALFAEDPVSSGVASGVRATTYRIDEGPEQSYGGEFRLPLGRHSVRYRSVDQAGNAEPERSASLMVEPLDSLPPRTSYGISGPRFGTDPVFVAGSARFTLTATDDRQEVGDGIGVGVASTSWAFDDAPFGAYAGDFPPPEAGSHWLRFYSSDRLGHAESPNALRIAVDGTAPVPRLEIGAPQALLASGDVVIASHTELSASAEDPLVAGVASGVAELRVGVDGAEPAPAAVAFRLPAVDGTHAVLLQAVDHLGNVEPPLSRVLHVDQTPPITSVSVEPAAFETTEGPILGAATLLSVSAADPEVNGTAAGVHHTEHSLDGSIETEVTGSLALEEGSHSLRLRSWDNVGNAEPWREAVYRVDATPPLTTLETGSPSARAFGQDLIAPRTPLSLSAQDPVSAGVASGVRSVAYRVDGGAEQGYAGPFLLPTGTHTVSYWSVDNAGNAEPAHSASFVVGGFPGASVSALDSVSLSGGAVLTGEVRATGAFTAAGKSHVEGDVAAATVELTGKSTVSGTITRPAGAVPDFDLFALHTEAAKANDNASVPGLNGNITLTSHAALALPAGGYFVTGIDLSAGATLSVSGAVTLFVAGPIRVTGGASINAAGSADDLWVLSDGDETTLAGGGRTAMHLIAPNAALAFAGGGDMAGRVVGRTVSFTGHASHPSDLALPALSRSPGQAKKLAKAIGRPGKTATRARAKDGEVDVAASRLDRERPAPPTVAREAKAGTTRAVETLSSPIRTSSTIASSSRIGVAESFSTRPGQISARVALRGVPVKEARERTEKPAATPTRASSAREPRERLDELPAQPRHGEKYEALVRHEAASTAVTASPRVAAKLERRGPAAAKVRPTSEPPTVVQLRRSAVLGKPSLEAAHLPSPPRHPAKYQRLSRHEPSGPEKPARPQARAAAYPRIAQARLERLAPAVKITDRNGRATPAPLDPALLPRQRKAERAILHRLEHSPGSLAKAARPEPRPLAAESAVRERRHEFKPPTETKTERESHAQTPALDRAQLQEPPRRLGGVLAGWTHEATPETSTRPGPGPAEGSDSGSMAIHAGERRRVSFSRLDSAAPEAPGLGRGRWIQPDIAREALPQAPITRALTSDFPTRAVPTGRSVPTTLSPFLLARSATLALVTPTTSHSVRSRARSGVVVPEGAAKTAVLLTVTSEERLSGEEHERRERAAKRRTIQPVGPAVSYGPEGTSFDRPVTLELAYERKELPAGLSEKALAIHYWNPRSSEWEPLASEVDTRAQVVRALTSHFSTYQLLAPAAGAAAEARAELLGEVYPYPNPARPGRAARLRIRSGADRVEVRLYDLSGELKQAAAYDQPPAELDHLWDLSGVGSGVYVYTVTATRAGEAPARARGKLGVLR